MGPSGRFVTVIFVGLLCCDRPSAKGTRLVPAEASLPTPSGAPARAVGGGDAVATADNQGSPTPGPLLLPAVSLPNGSVPIHASHVGWTADGRWFGFCGAYGEAMAETRCSEVNVVGQVRPVDLATRRGQPALIPNAKAPIWRYGGELRLNWEIEPPAYLDEGPPHRAAAFVFSGGLLGPSSLGSLARLPALARGILAQVPVRNGRVSAWSGLVWSARLTSMKVDTISEAKAQLSALVDRALAGEEVIIGRAGKPVVRLVPVIARAERRRVGTLKGQICISPDFDELPPDIAEALGMMP